MSHRKFTTISVIQKFDNGVCALHPMLIVYTNVRVEKLSNSTRGHSCNGII